jgi:cytochrome b6-f complex iron-sulfur subunit
VGLFDQQTRRQFCAQTCQGTALVAVGGALASALQACGGGSTGTTSGLGNVAALPIIDSSLTSAGTVVITINASSPLAAVGSAALVRTSSGSALVAHTAADTFVAVSANCTHQACVITGYANQVYVCPCHGSQFATSGQVVGGPAVVSLPVFRTEFSNNVLTIL